MGVRVAIAFSERERVRDRIGGRGLRDVRVLLRRAATTVLRAEGVRAGEVSIVLVGDEEIAELNQRYLGQPVPTDVLAFPMVGEGEGPGEGPMGEVYIGVEQAVRQAEAMGVSVEEELVRLGVHGTLHVLGHEHPEGRGREASAMWVLQETLVAEVMRT